MSLTDVEGIYKDFDNKESLIKSISYEQLENLKKNLKGGMKKKAHAALEAIELGVKKVIICSGLIDKPIFNALENNGGTIINGK